MKSKLKFDETNQPYYFENGIKYYGCPECGASFKETCFCGTCNDEKEKCIICGDNVKNYPGSGYCDFCITQIQ